jgi:uncharacterized glyoxalase superfamily protein PhnB
MTWGRGMMMLGPRQGGAFDRLMVDPARAGGETTTIYVVVADVAACHARAAAAGAEIVIGLRTEDHGGESFSARDPEGHVWTFGSYDPWA